MNLFLVKLKKHLLFRISQLLRIINLSPNIGIAFIFEIILFVFIKIENNLYYPYIFLIPIFIFHFRRKDNKFLQHVFYEKWKIILLIENSILFSFFCLINLNYQFNYLILFPIVILILISLLDNKSYNKNLSFKSTLFSKRYFEINSNFRKNPFIFILIFSLLILSGFHPFTLFFYGIFFLDFFSNIFRYNESKEQLIINFKNQKLQSKIFDNLKIFNIFIFFTFIFYILMKNPIEFFIFYFVVINLFFSLIIIRKYALYFHKEKDNEYNTGIYMEYLIISFLVIPAIFKLNKDFKKAIKNIKNYVRN